MDMKQLKTFLYVAELNSFTQAADKLGYSQSTVSFQIRRLEEELDCTLFERINHTVVLTDQGRKVLEYAHKIEKMTKELKGSMQRKDEISGNIRLAMADSLCDAFFNEDFKEFRRRYPGIILKIMTGGTEEMFRLMNQNEADAILTLDSHVYDMRYVIAREEEVGIHFVAGKDCPLIKKRLVSIEEIIRYPFVLTEKGMSYRRLMDEKLAEKSLEVRPVLELGSTRLISSLVEQNVGISFLPDYVTETKRNEGKLFCVNVKDFEIKLWKQLLYRRDKWVSPPLESVLVYCMEENFSDYGEMKANKS
nr:LysR family transcriptional regulator [uncultured Anaerostipes sp.]